MPLLERVRTDRLIAGLFYHEPGEPMVSVEWWQEPCIAFTAFGSWEIRARRGKGEVTPQGVMVSEGGAEFECRHHDGMTDRMLCVLYRHDVDPGPVLVVPQEATLRSLRRSLSAQIRLPVPDPGEVESLSLALLAAVRETPHGSHGPGARARALVAQLQAEADEGYREPGFDLVARAHALGMSRTRFVHLFRDVVGLTPHRYLVELRVGHAARLLSSTQVPVTDICFDSGFGSMPSFYAAFRASYGMTPGTFRAARRQRRGGAHFS
jgi:AraC family transcriptional regulator